MIEHRDNFFVVTGCSGGGKSSIIEALSARGFFCIEEAGRAIVQEQARIGGDATPWLNPEKFCDLLVNRYIFLFEQVDERLTPVFFDRGIPEALTFARMLNRPLPEHHRMAIINYRYAPAVFITPPWPEIFTTDAERRHSFQDGLAEYPFTLEAYRQCGYQLVEVPKAPVAERVDFILQRVAT
jgi:predicted ATPase